MESKEEILKFQAFEQKINQVQAQLNSVEEGIGELKFLEESLEELKGSKDKEILSPIGRGIFIKSKIISEELLVDVGGKNFVKKDIDSAKEMIKKQVEKLKNIQEELNLSLEKIGEEITLEMKNSQKQN
jgi:prefoldin alpha subunit